MLLRTEENSLPSPACVILQEYVHAPAYRTAHNRPSPVISSKVITSSIFNKGIYNIYIVQVLCGNVCALLTF